MQTNTQGHLPGTTLTYGDIERDPAKLPEASVAALLARGFAHYLGNEQASKLVSRIRAAIVDGTERKVDSVDKSEVQAYREANAEAVGTMAREVIAAALAALDNGTVGVRTGGGGPRLDPLASAMNAIAKGEVITILKANGVKVPKGEETVTLGSESFTLAQLVARRLAHEEHGPKIRKEAEQKLAAEARKRAKIEASAKEGGVASLGL